MINHAENTILIPGPVGELELLTTSGDLPVTAIICHPHPLQGGTMNNKVVTTLMRTFRDLGLSTVRFNFRGIGKSAGSYGGGLGETDDLFAVMDWVKQKEPGHTIWLAGFSFGACVAIRGAALRPVARLVTIAPPVSRFDLKDLPPITCPWIMVQGDQDDIVLPQEVYDWMQHLNPQPQLIRFPTAGHFFHGQLLELREQLVSALQ